MFSNTAWTRCCYQENGANRDEMRGGGEFRGSALCASRGKRDFFREWVNCFLLL